MVLRQYQSTVRKIKNGRGRWIRVFSIEYVISYPTPVKAMVKDDSVLLPMCKHAQIRFHFVESQHLLPEGRVLRKFFILIHERSMLRNSVLG